MNKNDPEMNAGRNKWKKMNERMNDLMNERLNEKNQWKNEWMNESNNERKKSWGCLNCESQTYWTLKQRYCHGLVNIHAYTLEMVNIYTVMQEQ